MALNTIAALETALISWTNAGISSAEAQDMLTIGENRVYRELRVRDMEATTTVAITSGVVPVPTDYVELKNMRLSSNPGKTLERASSERVYRVYPTRSESGRPNVVARDGNNFVFGPYPSSGHSVIVNYYSRPATVIGGTLTGITATYPELLLFSALAESEPFLGRDNRIGIWEQKYQSLKQMVQGEDNKEYFSGSPLAVTTA